MKKRREIIYSEPVQEIMGTPPRKLIAWGTTILFLIFMLFLLASLYIRYPDLIPAPIEITTVIPPATLNAQGAGRIEKLLKGDRESVVKGDLIAVMESAANWQRIMEIEEFIAAGKPSFHEQPQNLPPSDMLGEIQISYTRFLRAYNRWYSSRENDHLMQRIESVRSEVNSLASYIRELKVKESLLRRDVALESDRFRRDSLMHREGVIPDSDYERSLQALINKEMDLQNLSLEIMGKEIERERRLQEANELLLLRRDEIHELESALSGAIYDLRADIDIWKRRYLLVAPISGSVTLTRYWSSNQFVNEGEAVVTIVPDVTGDYVGRITMSPWKSGKVKSGMPVNIKLSGYPFLEFGMLRGVVKSLSMVPDDKNYIVEVDLPYGLVTTYGVELDFTHYMPGIAEIRSEEMNLITRVVAPLRHVASLQRNR